MITGSAQISNELQNKTFTDEEIIRIQQSIKYHDDLVKKIKDNIEAAREYNNALLDQEKKYNNLKSQHDQFNKGLDITSQNLKSEIKSLENFSIALETAFIENAKEAIANTQKITELTEIHAKQIDKLTEKTERQKKAEEEYYKTQNKIHNLEKSIQINKQKGNDTINLQVLLGKYQIKTEEQLLKIKQLRESTESASNAESNIRKELQFLNNKQKLIEANNQEIAQNISSNNLKKIQSERTEELSKATGGLIDKLTGATGNTNLFTSAVLAAGGGLGKLTQNILGSLAESFLSPEKAMNRFFNFLYKNLIQSTFEFDKMLTEVNKKTGGMGKEFEQIGINRAGPFAASTVSGLAEYGVGLREVGDAYASLSSKVNGFNDLSEKQRKILATTAATMETLGVSSQTYAELTSKFMGSLGKTVEGTRNTINALAKDAIAAGRSVGEYTKEFEQLMPKIIGFGREATTIFKELNAVSAMTKGVMSAGDLQNFASQFDNWDSAAEAVSKLNAGLGGTSLNIQDLMRADPSEKLMMLKRTFDESGQDFDKLNIGYKRLLAEAFGGDVAKAASFFKGDLAEANRMMHEQAATEKELEERKKKSVEATQKLEKALEGVKIAFTPIIDAIAMVAGWIAKSNETIGGFGTFLVGLAAVGVPAVIAGFKLFSMAANSSFGGVARNILQWMGSIRKEIAEAKKEAAEIPSATKGGGGGDIASSVIDAVSSGGKGDKSSGGKAAGGGGGGWKSVLLTTAISMASAAIGSALTSQTSNNTEQDIKSSNIDSSTNYHNDGRTFLTKNGKVESVFSEGDMVYAAGAKTPDGLKNVMYGSTTNNNIESTFNDSNRADKLYQINQQTETVRKEQQEKSDQIFKTMNENLEKLVKKDPALPEVKLEVDGHRFASLMSEYQGMKVG